LFVLHLEIITKQKSRENKRVNSNFDFYEKKKYIEPNHEQLG
jgi:hypothetical protein